MTWKAPPIFYLYTKNKFGTTSKQGFSLYCGKKNNKKKQEKKRWRLYFLWNIFNGKLQLHVINHH